MAQRNEEAIKLLEEAGYSKANPLKFSILYNTNENHKKVAIAAASMWKANTKGLIDVKLENQEWKTYIDSRRAGRYDAARAGWNADYNQATTFGNYFLSNSTRNTRTQNMIKPLLNLMLQRMRKDVQKPTRKPKKFLQKISVSCQSLTM